MRIALEIACDIAAIDPSPLAEAAHILRRAADMLEGAGDDLGAVAGRPLLDINGIAPTMALLVIAARRPLPIGAAVLRLADDVRAAPMLADDVLRRVAALKMRACVAASRTRAFVLRHRREVPRTHVGQHSGTLATRSALTFGAPGRRRRGDRPSAGTTLATPSKKRLAGAYGDCASGKLLIADA